MSASSWQTASQVAILVAAIIGAFGGFGHYYFGKQANIEKAREAFQSSVRFHQLDAYWVEIAPDTYRVGLAATILNKDATRVTVFDGLGYEGGFSLTGSMTIASIQQHAGPVIVHGQYFLPAGAQQVIHILLPQEVRMTIAGGVPQQKFTGAWTFILEDTPFPVNAPAVTTVEILTMDDWIERSGET